MVFVPVQKLSGIYEHSIMVLNVVISHGSLVCAVIFLLFHSLCRLHSQRRGAEVERGEKENWRAKQA